MSKEKVTIGVLRKMANTVLPWLNFTSKVSEGPGKAVPCLDSQLRLGPPGEQTEWFQAEDRQDMETKWGEGRGNSIMYQFYSKPIANLLTILRRSAIAEGIKVATAV